MSNVFSISSSSVDLEDLGEAIEKDFEEDGRGKRGGGGPSRSKTNSEVAKSSIENAEVSRRKESEGRILKSLEQFQKSDNPDTNQKNVDGYANWLLKSFDFNEPYIRTEDLEYSQFRAGGPGGQNVNKVENAARYKHKITGLFANASASRSTPENQKEASAVLYERLQTVVKDWKVILKGIEKEDCKDAITTFILKSQEK